MDWPIEDVSWSNHDLNTFEFQESPTVVLKKSDSDVGLTKEVLRDKNDWENWFDDAPCTIYENTGFYAVLCSRALPVFEGEDAPISYISITRDTWQRLTRLFHVHRSITRTIARQVACFSSIYETEGEDAESKICFTARMSAYLPGDLALSVTYIPSTESTFAVYYGCRESQMQAIEKRLQLLHDKAKYPLLAVGVFAELERERLVALADQLLDKFTLRSEHLENGSWDPSRDMSNAKTQEHLALCLQSRSLIGHIRAVKRQLVKLQAEVDELGDYLASRKRNGHPNERKKVRPFKRDRDQMKKRLQDIIDEYDNKFDECNMIIGNTTLAMQTVWNSIARHDSDLNTRIAHANTTIALEAKRESTHMKSIALLTMTYLPLSSVAAVFSMDFFNWGAQDGDSVVSKYIWVFAVFAVGLTAITLLAWRHITYRNEKNASKTDERYGALELQAKMA